jgi:glycine/D-amino acid oxidase-like deaminating enzyme/nitrite reductase/ring-hydroxylating ferredoxin subunit
VSVLEKEFEAARRAGLQVSWAEKAPWGQYFTGKCLVFHNQAQFHPTKYLTALASMIGRMGGRIFTHTHATSVTGGQPGVVETKDGFRVEAKHIVVATNVPINEWVAVHTKQASYRSYVIGARVPTGSVPEALYWDTADPYHYMRVVKNDTPEDTLIIGGEDHKTGQEDPDHRPYANLEAWARERFPQIKKIAYEWSGQIVEPIDGLAYIGHSPFDKPNVYLATGDSGHGLTHGTIAGLLLTDLITEQENPWKKLYDPHRVHVSAGVQFVKENLNAFEQYLDWVTPGEAKEIEQIKPGEGAIVRSGLRKMAVYREPTGGLTTLSAVCPHLMALVAWNSKEKTWDCPAHGSRFNPAGEVLNGPANSSLEPMARPAKATVA